MYRLESFPTGGPNQRLEMICPEAGINVPSMKGVKVHFFSGSRVTVEGMIFGHDFKYPFAIELLPVPVPVYQFPNESDSWFFASLNIGFEPVISVYHTVVLQEEEKISIRARAPSMFPGTDVESGVGSVENTMV